MGGGSLCTMTVYPLPSCGWSAWYAHMIERRLCARFGDVRLAMKLEFDLLVRMFIVLTAMALLLISDQADAGKLKDPGQGHLQYKAPKTGPDYYIVRQSDSDKCSIVPGRFGQKPVGTVGNAPYANRAYANAALRLAPECKGGLLDEGH